MTMMTYTFGHDDLWWFMMIPLPLWRNCPSLPQSGWAGHERHQRHSERHLYPASSGWTSQVPMPNALGETSNVFSVVNSTHKNWGPAFSHGSFLLLTPWQLTWIPKRWFGTGDYLGSTCGVLDLRSAWSCGPYFYFLPLLLFASILHFDLVRLSIWVPVWKKCGIMLESSNHLAIARLLHFVQDSFI